VDEDNNNSDNKDDNNKNNSKKKKKIIGAGNGKGIVEMTAASRVGISISN
jgi:hypothetical protein